MHDLVKVEAVDHDCSSWLLGMKKQLVCCSDCEENFKKEAEAVVSSERDFVSSSSTSKLPSWLQQYKDENRKQLGSNDQVRFRLFRFFYFFIFRYLE